MAPSTPSGPVGIVDVARRAGVSVATVSQVFSGNRPVSEATRRRVLEAVAELGYEPNMIARSMRTRRSHMLALIVPDITEPSYPAIARGLQDVAGPAGYHVILSSSDADPETERDLVRQMVMRRVDGIGFAGRHDVPDTLLPAVTGTVPAVFLGGHKTAPGIDVLAVDDVAAGRLATEYLVGRGHRRIAFIIGSAAHGPAADRVTGYREALQAAQLAAEAGLVVRTDFTRAGGADGMRRLLDGPAPPDAVLCANDVVAIGALDATAERGLRVPDDVAVMGFDDIGVASLITPALTTVSIRPREQGRALGRLLLGRLDGTLGTEPQAVVFEPEVVARQSA